MKPRYRRPRGFTLVEMIVGMAVAVILVGLMLAVTTQIGSIVQNADSKLDAFQSAQAGYDLMTQKLSDATLNTYYDYDNSLAPTTYIRRSDLHFLIAQNSTLSTSFAAANANSGQSVFFQVPVGYSDSARYSNTQGLLNACGFFVQFGSDQPYRPNVFTTGIPHYRYRLMQTIQSAELNGIYSDIEGSTPENNPAWIAPLQSGALPIAANVIALIIWPRISPINISATAGAAPTPTPTPISTDYQYNSRQGLPTPAMTLQSEQLPPILQITLVAIDASSAARLENGSTPPAVIEQALSNKFTSTSNYDADLSALETALVAARIRYQVLTSSITLRESKWSIGQ